MSVIYYELQDYGDDFLMHHGIKGQKWGIRRTAEQLGHFTKRVYNTGKEAYQKASTKVKEARDKRIEEGKNKAILAADYAKIRKYTRYMNDEELNYALNRLDLTKKMHDLGGNQTNATIERGVKTIETIARVGIAVNDIKKASAEFKKTKAAAQEQKAKAQEQKAKAKGQRLTNIKTRQDILNARIGKTDVYKPLSEKASELAWAGAKKAGAAIKEGLSEADMAVYEYVKKRMGGG